MKRKTINDIIIRNNEITLYERLYRRWHPMIVKTEFWIVLTRFNYWKMKHDPYMRNTVDTINKNGNRILQRIDLNDSAEIMYMMGVTINSPGFKCYLVYSNGARRRIKLKGFSHRRFR